MLQKLLKNMDTLQNCLSTLLKKLSPRQLLSGETPSMGTQWDFSFPAMYVKIDALLLPHVRTFFLERVDIEIRIFKKQFIIYS